MAVYFLGNESIPIPLASTFLCSPCHQMSTSPIPFSLESDLFGNDSNPIPFGVAAFMPPTVHPLFFGERLVWKRIDSDSTDSLHSMVPPCGAKGPKAVPKASNNSASQHVIACWDAVLS